MSDLDVKPLEQEKVDPKAQKRRKLDRGRVIVALVLLCLLVGKVLNYIAPEAIRFSALRRDVDHVISGVQAWYRNTPLFHDCKSGTHMKDVPGGYVCTTGIDNSVYAHIFDTYPISGGSKTAIYPSITKASKPVAQAMLSWNLDVPRYPAFHGGPKTDWANLDPYKAEYWKFYYYSLQPTIPLIDAYVSPGNRTYLDRLWSIDDSFFSESGTSKLMWADEHAVAFRGMVLTYEWWKLREYHALTSAQSARLLQEISTTAAFLADPNHYQPEMNHGTNESASLLLMAYDFPSLPNAKAWLSLARTRLSEGLAQLIDADGVLIENSPYYHAYEMDKLWQIYQFTNKYKIDISSDFKSKILSMVHYLTYALEPDDSVPLLGSSLAETIHNSGAFAQMAKLDPSFKFVITQGRQGKAPAQTSKYFATAGQTILRSGWGKGSTFTRQSDLTFNVGSYRTLHSQLDLLGVTLYDNGYSLLPPGGLYTYAPGAMYNYFHGTSAHNAVVVDGKSQTQGSASAGPLETSGGLTYQSGSTSVYDGVADMRTVVMIDKDHFLVVDRLQSKSAHTYEQTWHLFPGAKVTDHGLTVTATGAKPGEQVTISQLGTANTELSSVIGQQTPPAGLCSRQYGVLIPCDQLSYKQMGLTASYTTLISAGPTQAGFSASFSQATNTVEIHNSKGSTRINLGESPGKSMSVTSNPVKAPTVVGTAVPGTENPAAWTGSTPEALSQTVAADDSKRRVLALSTSTGTVSASNFDVAADLSKSNLQLRVKVENAARVSSFSLDLTSNHGASYTRLFLQTIYDRRWTGEWTTLSLARDSRSSGVGSHWTSDGAPIDWSSVNGIRLTLSSRAGSGPSPAVLFDWIHAVPEQASGVVSIVFDDGYESILPAANYLNRDHFPANVAVIGRSSELPTRGYLNVFELRHLQDDFGWNMVNHTQKHLDAVSAYDSRSQYGAYEQDILDGATWLERAGLNSAPDWLIYPHGTTNAPLDSVVKRFYTFARTTIPGPEAYPFGDPLRVKTFELHSPGDTADGSPSVLTPVQQVVEQIQDAKTYHTTLIITLHRIHSTASDRPGYPLADFEKIVDAVKASGLPVKTLSGLDAMNGVPETDHVTVTPAVPSLITVHATTKPAHHSHKGLFGWLGSLF